MINRIKQIIKEKNISVGQFADLLDVQRSGMSHVLNGRNNPSLHFVKKILEVYPDINPKWLLFGEEDMYMNHNANKISVKETLSNEYKTPIKEKVEIKEQPPINENTKIHVSKEKNITKIIIFYSDNTFEVNYPLN